MPDLDGVMIATCSAISTRSEMKTVSVGTLQTRPLHYRAYTSHPLSHEHPYAIPQAMSVAAPVGFPSQMTDPFVSMVRCCFTWVYNRCISFGLGHIFACTKLATRAQRHPRTAIEQALKNEQTFSQAVQQSSAMRSYHIQFYPNLAQRIL